MNRRQFLQRSTVTGAGALILPSISVFGQNAPSNKLNVGLIGVWGRGLAHQGSIKSENVVALCDINENHLASAHKKFPKAKTYIDWRKLLDDKSLNLDAILCCTPDHTHAHISAWALNRDLHVYMEKPIGISVEECRAVRELYNEKKDKLATQIGTQRHAGPNFNRVRELIVDGAIGELKHAYAWGNRKIPKPGYHPAKGEPPPHLHYDLWLGPAPYHPYHPEYFSGGPGANCLKWNMYWDFGTGQIGDMGSHTLDLCFNPLDADVATEATAKGEKFNPEVSPVKLEVHCKLPANDWRPEIGMSWYQGGAMPKSPRSWVDVNKIGHGAMYKGDKGFLICDFRSRLLIPFGDSADMSYYNRREKEKMIPNLGHFQGEWVKACKGDLKTSCDFDYSGKMLESIMLGLVAYRMGKKIEYNPKTGRITNLPEAEKDLCFKRKYREGWPLNG